MAERKGTTGEVGAVAGILAQEPSHHAQGASQRSLQCSHSQTGTGLLSTGPTGEDAGEEYAQCGVAVGGHCATAVSTQPAAACSIVLSNVKVPHLACKV